MPTRIEKILSNARVSLADKNAERWTDEDLLAILDEGHKDFCRHTKLLNAVATVEILPGTEYFDLPEDCWMLTRAEYDSKRMPFKSTDQMDRKSEDWFTHVGYPELIVYDRRGLLQGRLYPIADDSVFESVYSFTQDSSYERVETDASFLFDQYEGTTTHVSESLIDTDFGLVTEFEEGGYAEQFSSNYGVLDSVIDTFENLVELKPFVGGSVFGVTVGIDNYTMNSVFGTATELYEPGIKETYDSDFGVITDVFTGSSKLKLYYIRNPKDLTSVNEELDTPYMFDTALKYYVVGQAFLNDLNEQYQVKGGQQLTFYTRELEIAKQTQEVDGIRAASFQTDYRRGV